MPKRLEGGLNRPPSSDGALGTGEAGVNKREELAVRITLELLKSPGLTARDLAGRFDEDKTRINGALYSRSDLFFASPDVPPQWWLQKLRAVVDQALQLEDVQDVEEQAEVIGDGDFAWATNLYSWQKRALQSWEANGFRGVIEAVTGSGKTRVALAAAERHLSEDGKVAVVVPTHPLLEQWVAALEGQMPNTRIGVLRAGDSGNLAFCDVLVAVVNSASAYELGLPPGRRGLLIADECHRYAGELFRLALEERFERRLGLTATYARDDRGHEDVLDPYFGGIVFSYGYADAVREGVVAPFRVALMPVAFAPAERDEYDEHTETLRRARRALLASGAPGDPYEEFILFVNRLSKNGTRREGMLANSYLSASSKRRQLLADTAAKYRVLTSLADAFLASDRSIVFTQTIDSASKCSARLAQNGVPSEALHSNLNRADRTQIFHRFAGGQLKVIVAPKLLDEGVDVPEADLGVIFAASQQRRQMVQRMGRVLRRKPDGRVARFAIIFVEGTSEDPDLDAHETFLGEILEVADDIQRFSPRHGNEALIEFLSPE